MPPDDTDGQTRPRRPSAGRSSLGPSYRLVIVHPPELAGARALPREEGDLGRSVPAPGVTIAHGSVSRKHARFFAGPAGIRIVDAGSSNGTWVQGADATEGRLLAPGQVLRLGDVLAVLETAGDAAGDDDAALPGVASAMRELRDAVGRAAADPSPALILGETGSGKEAVARALHARSGRGGGFLAINCAALSSQLVESQLFGHERGAFTGATTASPGAFRAAAGGTLFLDEIGELPLDLQPKLLRAIQEREVLAVGSTRPVRVDTRLVTATNRDLAADVERGAFRRDLFARLALWELRVPSLRERRVDVLAWITRLARTWAEARSLPAPTLQLSPDAAETLLLDPWPENLRGVERLVHQLSTQIARGAEIDGDDLPDWIRRPAGGAKSGEPSASSASSEATAEEKPRAPTKEELTAVLGELGGSVRAAAKHYRRDRRQIYRWIRAFGITVRDEGAEDE